MCDIMICNCLVEKEDSLSFEQEKHLVVMLPRMNTESCLMPLEMAFYTMTPTELGSIENRINDSSKRKSRFS